MRPRNQQDLSTRPATSTTSTPAPNHPHPAPRLNSNLVHHPQHPPSTSLCHQDHQHIPTNQNLNHDHHHDPTQHQLLLTNHHDQVQADDDTEENVTQEEKMDESRTQFGVIKMIAIASRLRSHQSYFKISTVYVAMYILSAITSTENNTLPVIEPYYLSLFDGHSALSTVGIMTSIALAVGKPPMSKIMDVFGRAEGVVVAMGLYMFGALLTSTATSVAQYGIARMAAALGSQGLQLAQMIIVADTSSLASRALLTSTITSPWLFTTWIGPLLGTAFLARGEPGYRAAYLLFGAAVPLCASVLVAVLTIEWRALIRTSALCPRPPRSSAPSRAAQAWAQLDVLGLLLLTIGCAMLLLPLTWRVVGSENWFNFERSSSLAIGAIVLVIFGLYESRFATVPVIPIRVIGQRTVLGGSAVGFWHFICQFSYESYFTSFLQVARFTSARDAQYVQQSYLFTACISAMICGVLVKWTRRYKVWVIVGIGLHAIGAMMMVRSRRLENPIWEIVLSQIIGGFGGGFTTLAAQLGVQAVVGVQDVGIATAVFLMITQIGGAVGSSLAGTVWNSRLADSLARRLPQIEHHNIPKIVGDLRFTLGFQGNTRQRINESYVDVQRMLNWIGLLALIPCLICGLMMENVNLGEIRLVGERKKSDDERRVEGRLADRSVDEEVVEDVDERSRLIGN